MSRLNLFYFSFRLALSSYTFSINKKISLLTKFQQTLCTDTSQQVQTFIIAHPTTKIQSRRQHGLRPICRLIARLLVQSRSVPNSLLSDIIESSMILLHSPWFVRVMRDFFCFLCCQPFVRDDDALF